MSWPDVREQKLVGFYFEPNQLNKEECDNPATCIKEIVMVFASYPAISYNHANVPLAVSYDTEFGLHTILFSKVRNVYVSDNYMTNVISDDIYYQTHEVEGNYVSTDQLNAIFRNMVREVEDRPIVDFKPISDELIRKAMEHLE